MGRRKRGGREEGREGGREGDREGRGRREGEWLEGGKESSGREGGS